MMGWENTNKHTTYYIEPEHILKSFSGRKLSEVNHHELLIEFEKLKSEGKAQSQRSTEDDAIFTLVENVDVDVVNAKTVRNYTNAFLIVTPPNEQVENTSTGEVVTVQVPSLQPLAFDSEGKTIVGSISFVNLIKQSRSYNLINELINQHPSLLMTRDNEKNYLIHAAIMQKSAIITEYIANKERGAYQSNLEDGEGVTPLFKAASEFYLEGMDALLKVGASRNRQCKGVTPLGQIILSLSNPITDAQIKAIRLLIASKVENPVLSDEEIVLIALDLYQNTAQQEKLLEVLYSFTTKKHLVGCALKFFKWHPDLLYRLMLDGESDCWPDNLFSQMLSITPTSYERLRETLLKIPLVEYGGREVGKIKKLFLRICNQQFGKTKDLEKLILQVAQHYLTFYYATLLNTSDGKNLQDRLKELYVELSNGLSSSLRKKVLSLLEQSPFTKLIRQATLDKEMTELSNRFVKFRTEEQIVGENESIKSHAKLIVINALRGWYKDHKPIISKGFPFNGFGTNPVFELLDELKQALTPGKTRFVDSFEYSSKLVKRVKESADNNENENNVSEEVDQFEMVLTLKFSGENDPKISTSIRDILHGLAYVFAVPPVSGQTGFSVRIGTTKLPNWKEILEKLAVFDFLNDVQKKQMSEKTAAYPQTTELKVQLDSLLKEKDWTTISSLLKDDKLSPNVLIDSNKTTLFLAAVSQNDRALIALCMSKRADTKAITLSGNNWLRIAVRKKAYKSLEALLQRGYGADASEWEAMNVNGISALKIAKQAYLVGDHTPLHLYIKYTGNIPANFLETTYDLTNLGKTFANKPIQTIGATMASNDIVSLMAMHVDEIPEDLKKTIREFGNDLFKKNLIGAFRKGISEDLSKKLAAFFKDARSDKAEKERYQLGFTEVLDLLFFFKEKFSFSEKIVTEFFQLPAVQSSLKAYSTYSEKAGLLIKDFLNDSIITCADDFNGQINKVFNGLCLSQSRKKDVLDIRNEWIWLFEKCGAVSTIDALPPDVFKQLANPFYDLSMHYNLKRKVSAKATGGLKALFKTIRDICSKMPSELTQHNAILTLVEGLINPTSEFGEETKPYLLNLLRYLQMGDNFKTMEEFVWLDGALNFKAVPKYETNIVKIMKIAANFDDIIVSSTPDSKGSSTLNITIRLNNKPISEWREILESLKSHAFFTTGNKTYENLLNQLNARIKVEEQKAKQQSKANDNALVNEGP